MKAILPIQKSARACDLQSLTDALDAGTLPNLLEGVISILVMFCVELKLVARNSA